MMGAVEFQGRNSDIVRIQVIPIKESGDAGLLLYGPAAFGFKLDIAPGLLLVLKTFLEKGRIGGIRERLIQDPNFEVSNTPLGAASVSFKDRFGADCSVLAQETPDGNVLLIGRDEDRIRLDRRTARLLMRLIFKFVEDSWKLAHVS